VTKSPPSARRKYLLFTIFTIISLVLDQWTKILARRDLQPRGPYNPKVVVEGWFDLRYAENPGVAFSMLQDIPGGRVLLTLLAIGAFLLVLYYLRKTPIENTRLHIALGLVGGGAIGNRYHHSFGPNGRDRDGLPFHALVHETASRMPHSAMCRRSGMSTIRRLPSFTI
jgi:lipoprotein signal peptidase